MSDNSINRPDFDAIVSLVPQKAKTLDLGCADGILLARLTSEKQVIARGVEIDESKARAAIARGLSVRQGNIEEGLADYPDAAFDYVILSQTLAYLNYPAPVVRDMLRVGKFAVISFDNAAYWRTRLVAAQGKGFGAAVGSNSPRERAITLSQFEEFCAAQGAKIERSLLLGRRWHTTLPSWRAKMAVYVIRAG
ncbi:MAG TPA: methionine biosynthesis protein MetW [Thermoflexales bacterium]|nr:methionine biosynthesis protein MetW [Thermoflexales bacterium]HQW36626.1 methionine biosynthesis protein MetW [Thermoflexales bacterium]HQZ23229.1 methionine biosynthesis protein MetW [Thermoflexales bacterium]HRA00571.1 methionine biosynthesis protein MetW [Thermoflexales bacterium]